MSARNLNDGSVEGLAHTTLPIRSYQYHPEGAPGPRDNEPVFPPSAPILGGLALSFVTAHQKGTTNVCDA